MVRILTVTGNIGGCEYRHEVDLSERGQEFLLELAGMITETGIRTFLNKLGIDGAKETPIPIEVTDMEKPETQLKFRIREQILTILQQSEKSLRFEEIMKRINPDATNDKIDQSQVEDVLDQLTLPDGPVTTSRGWYRLKIRNIIEGLDDTKTTELNLRLISKDILDMIELFRDPESDETVKGLSKSSNNKFDRTKTSRILSKNPQYFQNTGKKGHYKLNDLGQEIWNELNDKKKTR